MTQTVYTGVAVTVALVVVGAFFIVGMPFDTNVINNQAAVSGTDTMHQSDQLVVQDITTGTGPAAKPGDRLTVNYTGQFENGTVFDTSVGKAPFSFTLGAGQVIAGWDQGLVGAQAGTKRVLVIPSSLGYGPNDYGPIPGNSTLVFEVEVVSVEPAGR